MKGGAENDWSEDRVRQLRELWDNGLSTAAIAARLGITSRMAVIGKINRLGLSGRLSAHKGKHARVSVKRAMAMRAERTSSPVVVIDIDPPAIAAAPSSPDEQASTGRVALVDLGPESCRWAYGDRAPFMFCGCRATRGSYCAEHGARVYARAAAVDDAAEAA